MNAARLTSRQIRREEHSAAILDDAVLIRRLLRYLRPYAGYAGASLAMLMLSSVLSASWPLLTQVAVDRYLKPDGLAGTVFDPFLPDDPANGLIWIIAIYFIALTLSCLIRGAQIQTMHYTGQRVTRDIRDQVFRHLQTLPVPYFDRMSNGRLVTRATNDVDAIVELFNSGFIAVVGDVLSLVFTFGAMTYLSPTLTLVYLAVSPLIVIVSLVFRSFARSSSRGARRAVANLASFLQECLSGISVVQVFNYEPQALKRFDEINKEHLQATCRSVRAHAVFFPVIEWLNYFGLAMLIVFGAARVVDGSISLGVLLAFVQYGTRVFGPIQNLAEKYNTLQAALASAERIFELLDTTPTRRKVRNERYHQLRVPSVEFRNVWFAYRREDWVLKDVTFKVEPGEALAVVGHTGAGKSTLVNLLLRFYEIQRGTILVGGQDIQDWEPEALRAQFSVVFQDPYLFSGTIAENIGLGDQSVPTSGIRCAAANAHLADHVESLPLKYDEQVLGQGAKLSSGLKQLVALARAFATRRPFLVLDEATSSVDPDTERNIRETVSKLLVGRTSIVIAHRLSTIHRARRILVLHKGRVAETGTHADLMSRQGIYSHLYQMQTLSDAVGGH